MRIGKQIPLKALRTFEAVARHRSFNASAAELGVTPSAVSLQIRRLEDQLGRPLFKRSVRPPELTELGRQLAPGLTALFGEFETLLATVLDPEDHLLRISAMPSFAATWLAPRLPDFSRQHPRFTVRLAGEDALADFERGRVDVGIRYGGGVYKGLRSDLIASVNAFPVCSPAFLEQQTAPLREPRDLLAFPLIRDEVAEKASGLPTWHHWLETSGVKGARLPPGPQFESHHLALSAAQNHQGIALGLSPLVDDDLRSGRLVRLLDHALPSPFSIWLVCREERSLQSKVARFRAWLLDQMQALRSPVAMPSPPPKPS